MGVGAASPPPHAGVAPLRAFARRYQSARADLVPRASRRRGARGGPRLGRQRRRQWGASRGSPLFSSYASKARSASARWRSRPSSWVPRLFPSRPFPSHRTPFHPPIVFPGTASKSEGRTRRTTRAANRCPTLTAPRRARQRCESRRAFGDNVAANSPQGCVSRPENERG